MLSEFVEPQTRVAAFAFPAAAAADAVAVLDYVQNQKTKHERSSERVTDSQLPS